MELVGEAQIGSNKGENFYGKGGSMNNNFLNLKSYFLNMLFLVTCFL